MIRAAALALCLAQPAWSLSCLPYGVTDAFLAAAKAQTDYVLVRGTLRYDPADWPSGKGSYNENAPAFSALPGRITGVSIGKQGRRVVFERDVTLEVQCFGPWCPGPSSGDVLAFVRREGTRHAIATDPCGGFLFGRPTERQMRAVLDCLDGRACTPVAPPPLKGE